MLSSYQRAAALAHPGYHRYLMFGKHDAYRSELLGRPLAYHESQSRLPWPHRKVIKRVERAIAAKNGEVICVRSARQTAKNECDAMIACRMMAVHRGVPGSVYVRVAPTYRPQIVISKRRLVKHLKEDPVIAGDWTKSEGYIYQCGHAEVHFLSGSQEANVVGSTASIALSVDEAHKIDHGKFDEDLAPFTASTNAPIIMWGVGADKQDLLYEYREMSRGTDRVLDFPASVWCEISEAWAKHYESRRKQLGDRHLVILTQYDLEDVEAAGAYLSSSQRASLFSGDHPRLEGPRDGMQYYVLVDVGGESEQDGSDEIVRSLEPRRDSTWIWIVEIDPQGDDSPYPLARVVAAHWWTGRKHVGADAEEPVSRDLLKLCAHWGIAGGCVDSRGVGEALAKLVHRQYPAVVAYAASGPSASEDCYDLHARLNTGRLLMWRGDPSADDELREFQAQARHTRYEIWQHDKIRLLKPTGSGSSELHIDGVKALTYLRHALKTPYSGFMSYVQKGLDGKEPT